MKLCYVCKESKSFDMFSKDASRTDGHQPRCKECHKKYKAEHKSEIALRKAQYYVENKSKMAAYSSQRQKDHRIEAASYVRKYNHANPDKCRVICARRRAIMAGVDIGFMPRDPLTTLVEVYGPLCVVPGCIRLSNTVDHVVPISKGGAHSFFNMQPMCKPCNSSKGNRNSIDYRPLRIISLPLWNHILG